VEWITREHIDHDEIHAAWTATYHSDPYTWGNVVLFRIAPISMWAYAFHPEEKMTRITWASSVVRTSCSPGVGAWRLRRVRRLSRECARHRDIGGGGGLFPHW
jgi:hypothetical protein